MQRETTSSELPTKLSLSWIEWERMMYRSMLSLRWVSKHWFTSWVRKEFTSERRCGNPNLHQKGCVVAEMSHNATDEDVENCDLVCHRISRRWIHLHSRQFRNIFCFSWNELWNIGKWTLWMFLCYSQCAHKRWLIDGKKRSFVITSSLPQDAGTMW